jgi:hypothetical protein
LRDWRFAALDLANPSRVMLRPIVADAGACASRDARRAPRSKKEISVKSTPIMTSTAVAALCAALLFPPVAYAEEPAPAPQAAPAPSAEPAEPGAAEPAAPVAPAPQEDAAKKEGEAEAEAPKPEMSEAQKALFNTPHLSNIKSPSVITYDFERKSVFKDGFKDTVKVKVDKVLEDGAKDVSFEFFTAERNRPYPPQEHFFGNPLVMLYLSRDVHEMARLVGGSANYYRSKIRYGMFDQAEVAEVEVAGPNGPVKGRKITIRPFLTDAQKSYEMGPNLAKSYEFVVADEIPGGIYSIKTLVPPEKDKEDKGNVIEESLVFQNVAASPVADAKN